MFNDEPDYSEPFKDQYARQAFISKVYTIITIQLLFTCGVVSLFVFVEDVQTFARANTYLVWVCMGLTIFIMLVLACCESVRRTPPQNVICLIIFTIAESFLVGFITSFYDPNTIILALGITAVVVIALTIFAIQTKIDFTMCGGLMLVLGILLLILGIVSIFYRDKMFLTVYASIGVFIFSIYLIYDIQLLIGDKQNSLDTVYFNAIGIMGTIGISLDTYRCSSMIRTLVC